MSNLLNLILTAFFKLGDRPLFRVVLVTNRSWTVVDIGLSSSNSYFREEVRDLLSPFVTWKETKRNTNSFCQFEVLLDKQAFFSHFKRTGVKEIQVTFGIQLMSFSLAKPWRAAAKSSTEIRTSEWGSVPQRMSKLKWYRLHVEFKYLSAWALVMPTQLLW